VKRPE